MIRWRGLRTRRLGATLAGLGLYLQFVFAGWGMLALAAPGQAADELSAHALCLAAESGMPQPAAPANDQPAAPVHDHLSFCCLWHSMPGLTPRAALLPVPVVYAAIGHNEPSYPAVIPGPLHRPANARAPPILA